MSQDKQEQEFEEYLRGDSRLSASYKKVSSEQAPAHLDDAILAASRRAVQSKPRYAFSPFASDWHVPLSMAAVLVLSVTVIISIQYDGDESYLGSPETNRPQSVPVYSEDSFEEVISNKDMPARQDFADEKEEMPQREFDSAFANEPAPVGVARIRMRENFSAGKVENEIREELIALPAKSNQKTSTDMPTAVEPKEQLYARPPLDTRLNNGQKKILKSDTIESQMEHKSKQKHTELTKKRAVLSATDKIGRAKTGSPSISSATESMNKEFTVLPADIDNTERGSKEWLALIRQLWLNDKRDEALRQLLLFNKKYPEYDQKELSQYLDSALLEKAKTK